MATTLFDAVDALHSFRRLPERRKTEELCAAAVALERQLVQDFGSVEEGIDRNADTPLTTEAEALLDSLLAVALGEVRRVARRVSSLSGVCIVIVGDLGTLPDMEELALGLQGLAAGVEIRAHVPLSSSEDRTS